MISALPKNYKIYYLSIEADVRVSNEDIASIYEWTEAIRINIDDSIHQISQELRRHIRKLRQLRELQQLRFVVTESTFATFSVHSFAFSLPKIQTITVDVSHLNGDQVQVVINHQTPLRGWNIQLHSEESTIEISKRIEI